MRTVAFVAPFFLPATIRFLRSVVEQRGVRVGLISADPVQMLPADLRQRLAAHHQTPKAGALSAAAIQSGVQRLASVLGGMPQLLLSTLEELQVPLAEVRAALGIPGMQPRQATNFREKSQMKDALRAAGLPCARHQRVDSVEAGMAFGASVKFAAVVKPLDGAGGKATYRVRSLDEMRAALRRLHPRPGRPVQCEEFVLGEERTLEVISLAGQPVWCSSCRYMPTPLAAIENPWIQWTVTLPREVDDPADATVRDLGFRALKALGMGSGLSHMEWFRRPDGSIAISEVAARPPGAQFTSLISYAHDCDFYRVWAEVSVLEEFSPPPRRFAAGAAYLRAQGTGRIASVSGLEEANRELGDLVVQSLIPAPGQMKSSSYEGDGYLILRHPETEVVRRGLERAVEILQVEAL